MIFVESLFNMPFSTMATVLMCWVHALLILLIFDVRKTRNFHDFPPCHVTLPEYKASACV